MGLSRADLWNKLGVSPRPTMIDKLIAEGYDIENEVEWRYDLDRDPHGTPWHTSFHASSFPGDNPKSCGRQALYSMLGIPRLKPFDRRGRSIMDAGKDIEVRQVARMHRTGRLISEPPWAKQQTGFVMPKYWLTGNVDAVVLPEGYVTPHPVEIKGKDDDAVQKMWRGEQSYDEPHRQQLLSYIGLAHDLHDDFWPLLQPATDGTLLYVSRNRPYNTREYVFEYDPGFMRQGYRRLEEWQRFYIDGDLPPRDKSWRWTETPCKWCDTKKLCKADQRAGVTKLRESKAVEFARELLPSYDYDANRAAVYGRWYNDKVPHDTTQGAASRGPGQHQDA